VILAIYSSVVIYASFGLYCQVILIKSALSGFVKPFIDNPEDGMI